MIKLYTDRAGKELNEYWNEAFGAWKEEDRNAFEHVEGEKYYSFYADESMFDKTNDNFEDYEFVIKNGINIDFKLVRRIHND